MRLNCEAEFPVLNANTRLFLIKLRDKLRAEVRNRPGADIRMQEKRLRIAGVLTSGTPDYKSSTTPHRRRQSDFMADAERVGHMDLVLVQKRR